MSKVPDCFGVYLFAGLANKLCELLPAHLLMLLQQELFEVDL